MLGIAYHKGDIVKRNDRKALAWFRESCRNGNVASYLNAGDLLAGDADPDQLHHDRYFAFVNYLGAY